MSRQSRPRAKKQIDLEDVLIDEFQVPVEQVGHALAKFFNVTYEAYQAERVVDVDLVKRLKRQYVDENFGYQSPMKRLGMTILALDPSK